MAYDVKFYKPKRPATSPDDLTPDNLDDMGSGDDVKQQLAPVIPDFIWDPTFWLGSHEWHRAGAWLNRHDHYVFWVCAEPTNSEVRLVITARERVGREKFVQGICDALGWVAVVDRSEPPRRTFLFFAPRSTDMPAQPQ